jgi:CARDB
MIRTKIALAVGLGLVALLAAAPLANAKHGKEPLPDLAVGKVSKPPASVVVGTKLNVVVKLRNKGKAKAGKSRLGLYLATGKKHRAKKDRRLGRAKIKALRAHKRAKAKFSVVFPANVTPGTYRLIACADDSKRLRESKERDNCDASQTFTLAPQPPASGPARPAFTMTDGLDWGFVEDANENTPGPGDPVTATLTAGNGIAGQTGYARTNVGAESLLTGTTTTFNYATPVENEDDGAVTTTLPFVFPFGGINEQTVSVSTNGWISFGSPAWDYWDDEQPFDYRGINTVVGTLERGIMPYWSDLDVGEPNPGDGTVKMVVPAGGSSVAFQWDVAQHSGGGAPRRVIQLVLFPDGHFRFDYPGPNTTGGNESFIGYSLGTGDAGIDTVGANVEAVPTTSLLFTPNAVPVAGALAAGQATLTLPAGSSFVSGSPGCAVTSAPGPFATGLASCPVPGLANGQQVTQTVTFAMPPNAPGESSPANFRFLGTYLAGGFTLTDGDEIDALSTSLGKATINVTPEYTSPPAPEAGKPAFFTVKVQASSSLDEPTATFTLPANTTLNSIQIAGKSIDCDPQVGSQVTCRLTSGDSDMSVDVSVTPTAGTIGTKLKLAATAQALNAPADSGEVESPIVIP